MNTHEPPTGHAPFPAAIDALAPELFAHFRALELTQPTFVIGGYVRDHLLGRPCKDIDITTEGSGLQLAEAFAKQVQSNEVAYFENFGTAMVKTGDWTVEFVGARRESYRRNSRKPIVEDGTLEDDQLRRDFTINALAIGLNANNWGQLVDPFGGIGDLQEGWLRTPTDPDITFSDDPLRMLRGIRFATTLGFRLTDETWQAIVRNRERISILSAERISEELNKIILAPQPSIGFNLLFDSGLLHLFFPEMVRLQGVDKVRGIGHKDNFYHTLQVLDNICRLTPDLWTRWAAILHDIAKPDTKRFDDRHGWTFHGHEERGARMVPRIFNRMRLPQNEKMKFVQKLVRLHLRPIALVDEGVSDSAIRRLIVDAGEDLQALMTLCRADITTRDSRKLNRFLQKFDELEAKVAEVESRDELRNWQPAVTGQDIMEHFHLKPGPEVGALKLAIRNAILDGVVPNSRAEGLAWLETIAPEVLADPRGWTERLKLLAPEA